jgi:hypothetical protein
MGHRRGTEAAKRWARGLRASAALILLTLTGLLPGCTTHYLKGQLEKRIAVRLRSLIGPANHYSVQIEETRDAELVLGRLRRIRVEGRNVLVGGVIRLDVLRLDAQGVRFRGGPDRLDRVRWSHLAVEITDAALNEYLAKVRPAEQAHVALHEGEVTLRGVLRLLGTPVEVEARGPVAISDGRRLIFRAREVIAPSLQLPGGGVAFVERQVNPLVDMNALEWPVRLDAVHVDPEKILLEGSLDMPQP